MNEQEKQQLQELLNWKKSLESSHSLPLHFDQAIRGRFKFSEVKTSTKASNSENRSVDEGGVATYSVLKAPDAFVEVLVGSTTYYIPVFT